MAKKINQRDDRAEMESALRSTGQRKPRKALPHEVGANRPRSGRPPSDPTAMAMAARDATDINTTSPATSLTSKEALDRHTMRKGWFLSEAQRQAHNRSRMARCEAMYDGEQWAHDKAQELRDRGQEPVVHNEVKPAIDWLIGTERRLRIDFNVTPEDLADEGDDPDAADEDAQVKTKLLKYVDACNGSAYERSWAAEDAFKAGLGWLEVGLRGDSSGIPVFTGAESWRNILWDSQDPRRDLQHCRYLFRIKVLDLDVAEAIFPDKKEELARCMQTGDNMQQFSDWFGGAGALITGLDQFGEINDPLDFFTSKPVDMFNSRRRVLLLECWSRDPVPRNPEAPGMGDPVQFRINVAIMTEHDTLLEAPSPYKHDRFPFVPIWSYRNRRTGLPYSPVWQMIGPQTSLNERMSKSLFEANSNQIEIEVGAIDQGVMDIDELRAEYNDPNGMPVLASGAISGSKVRHIDHGAKAREQLLLADRETMSMRSMVGVTGENRGERTNAISGKAVLAKQDQGSLLTAELFDNLAYARQIEGELTLSLIEQGMLAPRRFRAPGGAPGEIVAVNIPQPDGSYLNDLSARRARFVVGEQPWKQSYAEAAFESLFQVFSQLAPAAPQAVINLLDLVFDMHPHLPKKRAFVQRMRSINGQSDPDGKLSPEQQAELAQKQAVGKAQFEAQMAKLVADVQEVQARGANLRSEAVLKRLQAVYEAAQAASVIASLPEVAPIADEMLRTSGFEDQAPQSGLVDDPLPPAPQPPPLPGTDPLAQEGGMGPEIGQGQEMAL